MPDDKDNPRATSSAYDASAGYWHMVNAILCGAEAMRVTGSYSVAGPASPYGTLAQLNRGRHGPESPYLPRFPNETSNNYERRRRNAFLTNVYGDTSNNLASKPFSKTCELAEESGGDLKLLAENIDGLGNNLHVFARNVFKAALDKGITWTLVDFTKVPPGATLAAERDMGARPYWVHVPCEKLLAVYSNFVNGREIIFHARIDEPCTEVHGYKEVQYNRVRELNRAPIIDANDNVIGYGPATWTIWEEVESKDAAGKEIKTWIVKDDGLITVGFIPLVPLILGKRDGTSWKVEPPLRDLVYMQVKLFQQESNLDYIKELTAFPMLTGNGVSPKLDESGVQIEVPVGPATVLFTEMSGDGSFGSWSFIEPSAQSLTFLQGDNKELKTEMRDLGMQPLTTANLTVITTGQVAVKANSAAQAWGLGLKDALEQQWKFTCLWLGQKIEPEVNVHLDFGVDLNAGNELDSLLKAEGQAVLSKQTVREEFKRRGVLSDDYDEDEEEQRLAEQQQGLEPEQPIDPRGGRPLEIDPLTGRPVVAKPKLVG